MADPDVDEESTALARVDDGGSGVAVVVKSDPFEGKTVETTAPIMEPPLGFCPGCFASSEDGSGGEVVVGQWCMNCGSTGTVLMPRWAIDSIRKQASWVGKRFYPSEEDLANRRELRYLRSIAPAVPIEVVQMNEGENGSIVRYGAKRDGTTVSAFETEMDALEQGTRILRYPVPDDFEPRKSG